MGIVFLYRSKNYHQRTATFIQATGRSNDTNYLLPDGVRTLRASSVHGGTEK